MKSTIFIILIVISAGLAFAQDSTVVFDRVYQGEFPVSLWGKQTKPAHLVKDQPDYLVTLDSAGFETFRFDATTWIQSGRITFPQNHTLWDFPYPWTVGDLNNDGVEEIVTWSGMQLIQFNLLRSRFERKEYNFPLTIEQGVIGDIDNDGRNELVAFAYADSLYRYVSGYKGGTILDLCVSRLDSGKLKLIFADGGMSGYRDSKEVPPDMLHFIAPFTSDKNQLVITTSQSDVSPSFYHVLPWDLNMLGRPEMFHLINGRKVGEIKGYGRKPDTRGDISKAPIPEYPFSYGQIFPIALKGKLAFIDAEYNPPNGGEQILLELEGDHFKILHVIFKDSYRNSGGNLWMDIDGKGKGLLGVTYLPFKSGDRPDQMNWHYSFYREH